MNTKRETQPCELCRRVYEGRSLVLDILPSLDDRGNFTRLLCKDCSIGVINGRLTREGASYRIEGTTGKTDQHGPIGDLKRIRGKE